MMRFLPTLLLHLLLLQVTWALTPNALLSRNKTVNTSNGNVSYLTDNKQNGTSFNVSNKSWIALKTGSGFSKLFFTWNNPNYTWSDVIAAAHSCKQTPSVPVNYTLQVSSNSTNGQDGQWTVTETISGNNVTARGHQVNFTGNTWIRMNIETGGGAIDEIEVFDLSQDGTDTWFFTGTSISANTFKATPPVNGYNNLIHTAYPSFNPAVIRGAIPCISSSDLVTDLNAYLASAGNVKYWAIEMGTNDAWGGSASNAVNFKKNLQKVITACKNAGIQPVLARVLATNATLAKWQVHPDFLKAVDELTQENNLIAGPDLYGYFSQALHAGELNSDGVHPNANGAASIQRLWAEKMAPLYASSVTGTVTGEHFDASLHVYPNPSDDGKFTCISTGGEVSIEIYNTEGQLLFSHSTTAKQIVIKPELPSGLYLVKFREGQSLRVERLVIR